MEKVCEFCMSLRPAVYCQADSALLCLSCDSKVHSANALSNRHLRSPLCDSCQAFPASIRCMDHMMYMCRSCDRSLHGTSCPGSQPQQQQNHQKHAIGSYIGCPSAKDFAALWDLDLNELKNAFPSALSISSRQEPMHFGSASLDAVGKLHCQQQQHSRGSSSSGSVISCTNSVRVGMRNNGMKIQRSNKISRKGQMEHQQKQCSLVIVQQILDLQRLQLNEANCYSPSPIVRREEKRDMSSSSEERETLKKKDGNVNEISHHSTDLEAGFPKSVSPLEEIRSEGFCSPFSSLDHLPSVTVTAGVSLLGDPFWQCRSPLQTGQNIQDLGLFQDLSCRDDFSNIPDVDMTFQNFEELFRGDQDPMRGLLSCNNDPSCSSLDMEISFEKSESSHAPALENASASSTACLELATYVNPVTAGGASASVSPDSAAATLETKEISETRYRDKKKARMDGENVRQVLLKDGTNIRKRGRGRQSGTSGCKADDKSERSY
ncbi:hypothetical protein SAY87_001927 [Trapa incisa]|uniref:B box-type domain-containing protein n=1 Tax=Trapa incisa TaxID=236973 RepID=A0AAN7JTB4_9MYRT|nr:hypothetical protein SAY87_001927 [Trapa incisa]